MGASALGLVSEMPSGPGVISEDLIEKIVRGLPPAIGTFLLTCKQTVDEILAQQIRMRVNTVQLCDRLDEGSYASLREYLPGVSLVQVIHVNGPESIDEARAVAPHVDAILLDSGNQTLPVKELGGTGRTHDWNLSYQIRELIDVPLFLAGGLNSRNVGQAIEQVRPFGVDVCTGVRTDGKLDAVKLGNFFNAVARASQSDLQQTS